ncbi:MAG TPA: hypothetical protein VF638_05525 [Sphingomonas sp.]|jgi:hypothetical protein
MSQQRRSTTAGAPARAAAARTGEQRRTPADDLDLAIRDGENLARDFRRGARTVREVEALEERAHAIAQAIVAPFRGPAARPSAVPLYISPDGLRAGW